MKKLINPETIVADRYRIVTEIGQGAFGTTYKAEDLTNYKRVAIKVLSLRHTQDWKAIELFEREAKILARIDHPAIPKYLDYFHEDTTDDRLFYLVQELIEGDSLSTLVKKGWRANEEQVRDIALQVLKILDDLQQMKPPIIHRDIKPSNILRRADGQIYLVDFGAVQDIYRQTFMGAETFIGTIGYMPPEQFRGNAVFASDLYSLGATLLFLLTHRSPEDLPRKRMKFDFRDRVKVSPEFANWLEKMLEPAIEERYDSAIQAITALNKFKRLEKLDRSSNSLAKKAPPKGTSVFLKRTQNRLFLRFPKNTNTNSLIGLGCMTLFLFFLSLPFCLLLIFNFFLYDYERAVLILFFLPIIVFLVSAFLINLMQNKWCQLEIDPCNYHFLGARTFGRAIVSGKTVNIQNLRLKIVEKRNENRKAKCLLKIKNKDYELGNNLTIVEKQWIVEEVSDFLKQLKSKRA